MIIFNLKVPHLRPNILHQHRKRENLFFLPPCEHTVQLLGHLHHAFHAVAVRFVVRLGGEKPVPCGSHRLVSGVFYDQRNHASLLSDMHPDKRLCALFAGFNRVIQRAGQYKRNLRLFDFLQCQQRNTEMSARRILLYLSMSLDFCQTKAMSAQSKELLQIRNKILLLRLCVCVEQIAFHSNTIIAAWFQQM